MRFWIEAGGIVRQYQVKIGSVDICHAAPVGCRLRRFALHETEATNSQSSVDAHAPYVIGHIIREFLYAATMPPRWSVLPIPRAEPRYIRQASKLAGTLGANNAEAAPAPRHGLDAPGWLRDDGHGFVLSESGLDAWNS